MKRMYVLFAFVLLTMGVANANVSRSNKGTNSANTKIMNAVVSEIEKSAEGKNLTSESACEALYVKTCDKRYVGKDKALNTCKMSKAEGCKIIMAKQPTKATTTTKTTK
jgi:hypothetical protein